MDEDVLEERENVISNNLPATTAVRVMNLVKTYIPKFLFIPRCSKAFHAVKGNKKKKKIFFFLF